MNPAPEKSLEFIWRRLEEPAEFFGFPLGFDPRWWLAIGIVLLLATLLGVYWLYWKESKTIGKLWSLGLATLRTTVLVSIFFIWLLPALRQVQVSEQQSKVALLFDTSASVTETMDSDGADAASSALSPTRQELLLKFLAPPPPASVNQPPPSDFLLKLLEKNPLVAYRFGEVLDPDSWMVTPTKRDLLRKLLPSSNLALDDLPPDAVLSEFSKSQQKIAAATNPDGNLPESKAKDIAGNLERAFIEQERIRERLVKRTSIGAALRDLIRKEPSGSLQGVIVFSDGHPTAGADQDLLEAITVASKDKVPVFTVGLGKAESIPNLRLVDVLAPTRVQPDDDFPIRVALDGQNLPPGQSANVTLTVTKPGKPPEDLPAKQVVMAPSGSKGFRGSAEFRVTNPDKIKGDWKFQAKVAALPTERTRADNISLEPAITKVEERKLQVLLMASAATREYHFVRTMLFRESDKFDITIYLQSAQSGTVQDIDPKKLLDRFPSELRSKDADPKNLGNYDVILAFDPDWRMLGGSAEATRASGQELLRKWVEELGGGLVCVAGPVHSFALARTPELQTIRTLFPVIFDESPQAVLSDRSSKEPWALNWDPAATGQPFLNLTDAEKPSEALSGFEEFFQATRHPDTNLADIPSLRGFFAFTPIKQVKPGAQVLARYADTSRAAQTPAGERQPFFVLSKVAKGNVFYIGSGETYRIRQYSEKFHERFWTKLIRQMSKKESTKGLLVVGSRYAEGETVLVEAELLDNNLQPLVASDKAPVKLIITPPAGANVPKEWSEGLDMEADKAKPGSYKLRFNVKDLGKYNLELRVPGTGEKLTGSFRVESSDPERDDVRPNHALLHRLASSTQGLRLLDESKRSEFAKALEEAHQRMKLQAADAPGGANQNITPENNTERLYFDLETAQYIPWCLDSNIVKFRTEGKTYDLWDKGVTIVNHLDDPDQASGPSWAMIWLIGLLGIEWLTRKLLRLA